MKAVLSIILVLSSVALVLGQQTAGQGGTVSVSVPKRSEELRRQQAVEESFKRFENLQAGDDSEDSVQFYTIPELRLTKEQKLQTALSKDELAKYADFLKLPKTGVFKIFPNLCGDSRVLDVRKEKCLAKDLPSISFYSFRRKIYDFQDWTDLKYQDKEFAVGLKPLNIGLITEISDGSIETLDKNSVEVKSVAEIKMPKKLDEIGAKKKEIEAGVIVGNLNFSHKIKINAQKTYLLRSYAYRTKDAAANDKRIDIIVAFKIVGIDENEGLTIIWKELFRGNSHQV